MGPVEISLLAAVLIIVAGLSFCFGVYVGIEPVPVPELSVLEGDKPCTEHVWIDPSNDVVTAGTWRMCLRCGLLQDRGANA